MRTAALLLLWSTMHCLALRLPWQVWRALATPRAGTSPPGRAVDAFLAERRAAAVAVARDGGEEVKALAFDVDGGGSVVAVVLASDSVDPAALARSVGAGGARLAPAADVPTRVGFDVGSVPPVGFGPGVVAVVDAAVADWPSRLQGGSGEGDRKLVLRDGPELLRLAGGRSAVIARARPGRDPAPAAVGVDATGGRATVVGVVVGKRQMARTLCFLSLAPSEDAAASWRALPSGRGVKVQAIVGATLERAKGTEQVRNAIRRLRCGQRVVVSGTPTWADAPTRWARWREKRRQLRDGQIDFRCDELEVLGSKAPPKPRRKRSPRRAAEKALPVLSMPADVRVARVDDAASAAAFASDVGGRGDDVVGLDAEWEPETDGPAAVLQVATRAAVYVLDLVALDGEALTVVGAALDTVLEKAVVVGFAVGNDLERAAAAHPALAGLRNATTRELRDYAGSSSLSGLAGALLGVRLDKRLQCSAWGLGARPLPDAWVAYAALDAYVCVLLHDSLADRGSDAVAALDVSAAAPRAGDLSAVDDPERTSALLGRGRQRVNHPKDDALTFVAGSDGALSGYDKRSGVVRLRDCSVFFVNWDPPKPNRRSRYFDRKYPNAMKRNGHGGLEVSWWPPRAFDESRLNAEPLLLFGRRGKAEFLFLGKLRFARPLAEDDPTATPGGLVFELLDGEALLARAADDAHYPGLGALLELGMNPDGGGS